MKNRSAAYQKILKLKKYLDFDGLDLIEKCLNINPERRINTDAALKHPFFSDIR